MAGMEKNYIIPQSDPKTPGETAFAVAASQVQLQLGTVCHILSASHKVTTPSYPSNS